MEIFKIILLILLVPAEHLLNSINESAEESRNKVQVLFRRVLRKHSRQLFVAHNIHHKIGGNLFLDIVIGKLFALCSRLEAIVIWR